MKPPARAIVGNLIWSADGGVWAVWRVEPMSHANTGIAEKLEVHARLRGLLVSLPKDSMLLSISERLDPWDVVDQMAEGFDLQRWSAWAEVCEASAAWLSQVPLRRRRYYVVAALPQTRRPWVEVLKDAITDVNLAFGLTPREIPEDEVKVRRRQANELQLRLAQQARLETVTAGELCWLYSRSMRRGVDEPVFGERWEPKLSMLGTANSGDAAERSMRRVLAHLTDAVVVEGGDSDDEDRPRHRRYVRIDSGYGTSYQTVLAMSDMPHYFLYPNGGGEWLYHADHVGFPLDWCVRIRSVSNADAQAKVRQKQRDLMGQVEQYEGEVTGAPPQLAEALSAIDEERAQLGSNPSEAELQVTILLSLAAPTLSELEEQAGALTAMFEPEEYGLARPTGGQAALVRSMWPGTSTSPVCRDYTQFMLARDLAAGSPFCGAQVGDPRGLLLGVSTSGDETPVLFDPAYGPTVNQSPSLAAVGRLGSGKSFFLKRLCWDAIARGGQVVTIDRTRSGEYVKFGESLPGSTQVIRLDADTDVRFDPLRTFQGHLRETVSMGFLSLLAGCSAQSDEGAALAEAVDDVGSRGSGTLGDVIDELARMGADEGQNDEAARSLARRLQNYRRSGLGQLAFGAGETLSLDADFIVFWAPNLQLPDRAAIEDARAGGTLLPEQVLAQALLYLVAAVGREVVFRDATRFAAALYDEAWALLASPFGQSLLIEGVRDGRKHNGAIWLASQHPNDVAAGELVDLLGSRFVFDQARRAVPAALELLGAADNDEAAVRLESGLRTGECFYRDVRGRLGLIQVLPSALERLDAAFNTAPTGDGADGRPVEAVGTGDGPAARVLDVGSTGEDLPGPEAAPEPIGANRPPSLPSAGNGGEASREAARAARTRVRQKRRANPLSQVLEDAEGTS